MASTDKILFITHDTFQTGAPIILLQFLRWLKSNKDLRFDILIRRNGPLDREFQLIAKTYNWNTPLPFDHIASRFLHYLTKKIKKSSQDKFLKKLKKGDYSLIYANTIACSDILVPIIDKSPMPVIMHIHELEMGINLYCDSQKFKKIKHQISQFIAVSETVRKNLIEKHEIPEEKISLVHEFAQPFMKPQKSKEQLLKELKIPQNAFIIGGAGTIEWRKGVDLFVQAANLIRAAEKSEKPIYFLWVGGYFEDRFFQQILHDVETAGLKDRLLFAGPQENPIDYYNVFDLFLLTSREDPFPLVVIESGQLGNPIICFDKNVGSAEFIDSSCGGVIPYLNVGVMANTTLSFYENPEKMSLARREIRMRTSNYTIDEQGPKLLDIINSFF